MQNSGTHRTNVALVPVHNPFTPSFRIISLVVRHIIVVLLQRHESLSSTVVHEAYPAFKAESPCWTLVFRRSTVHQVKLNWIPRASPRCSRGCNKIAPQNPERAPEKSEDVKAVRWEAHKLLWPESKCWPTAAFFINGVNECVDKEDGKEDGSNVGPQFDQDCLSAES